MDIVGVCRDFQFGRYSTEIRDLRILEYSFRIIGSKASSFLTCPNITASEGHRTYNLINVYKYSSVDCSKACRSKSVKLFLIVIY
jgi:hypothetical protein